MRWLKHPGGFCHSPAMSELRDALGFAGYGAFWVLLERIAETWNGQGEPELALTEKEWQVSCGFSPKQFRLFLEILQNTPSFTRKNAGRCCA